MNILLNTYVAAYKIWHGTLRIPGGGFLLRLLLKMHKNPSYDLELPEGHRVSLNLKDVSAGYWINNLLGDRFEEYGLLTAMKKFVSSDSVVWDVGANCGLFSYILYQESKPKELIFFEPNPDVFEIARNALLPLKNTRGFNIALSDRHESAKLYLAGNHSTKATLHGSVSQESSIEVKCTTADNLLKAQSLSHPNIIKIDTEGHEIGVLKGMKNILQSCNPLVFFEHLSISDEDILGFIPECYLLFSVNDQDGSLVPGLDRAVGHNCAMIPKQICQAPNFH